MSDLIKRLRKLISEATPGPWESVPVMLSGSSGNTSWGESEGRLINGPPQTVERETLSARWFTRKEDAAYIATANPQAVASLLDRIEALEREKAELVAELQNIANAKPHTWEDPEQFTPWAQSRARAITAKYGNPAAPGAADRKGE